MYCIYYTLFAHVLCISCCVPLLARLEYVSCTVFQAHATYPKFSPGYLSLHKGNKEGLELKWIPIDMLNCTQEDPEAELTLRCVLYVALYCVHTSVLVYTHSMSFVENH